MKKVVNGKGVLLAILFMIAISVFSFAAYYKAKSLCSDANSSCQTAPRTNSGMLWDILSHQFVSTFQVP